MTDTKQTAVLVGERPPKRLAKYTRIDDRVLSSINQYAVLPLVDFLDLIMDQLNFFDLTVQYSNICFHLIF